MEELTRELLNKLREVRVLLCSSPRSQKRRNGCFTALALDWITLKAAIQTSVNPFTDYSLSDNCDQENIIESTSIGHNSVPISVNALRDQNNDSGCHCPFPKMGPVLDLESSNVESTLCKLSTILSSVHHFEWILSLGCLGLPWDPLL